jgi:hypothetical protein
MCSRLHTAKDLVAPLITKAKPKSPPTISAEDETKAVGILAAFAARNGDLGAAETRHPLNTLTDVYRSSGRREIMRDGVEIPSEYADDRLTTLRFRAARQTSACHLAVFSRLV